MSEKERDRLNTSTRLSAWPDLRQIESHTCSDESRIRSPPGPMQAASMLMKKARFDGYRAAHIRARHAIGDHEPVGTNKPSTVENDEPESLDPNDSDLLRDQLKGETVEHAKPPRLEDEGQSGG